MANLYWAYDCETGGTNENTSDLLSIYVAILNEEYVILDELDLKLKPDNGRLPIVEAGALKVNGINIQNHLEDTATVTYSEAKTKIMAMSKKHLKKNGRFSNLLPFGYNQTSFDRRFVLKHLFTQNEYDSILHYKEVDVMLAVDFLKRCGYLPPTLGSLGTVVEYFNVQKRNAHEAKSDVLMTIDVDKALKALMKSKKDGGTGQNLDLISLLEME